jgi:hypothetical protein
VVEGSKLLINEQPLQALPTLAKLLGLDKAVILQQIQYWLNTSSHEVDGFRWIYNSYTEWSVQFPWLGVEGVRYHIRGLEKEGYLIAGKFNRDNRDKTKWYRINYEKLEGVLKTTHDALKTTHASVDNYQPLPETTTIDYLTEIEAADIQGNLKALLLLIAKLPYWGAGPLSEDVAWLIEFISDFPELSEKTIKDCRDYWDGRRARNKGIWKNRLRNWLKHDRERKLYLRPAGVRPPAMKQLPGEEELRRKAEALGLQS